MLTVDFHTHIFPEWMRQRRAELVRRDATMAELYGHDRARMATAEELVAAMDAAGVTATVAAGIGWCDLGLARAANDAALEAAHRYPGRVVAFCAVDPQWGEAAVAEVERCARLGARGVGELHPDSQGYRLDDAALLAPVMEAARRLGLVVMAHASEPVGHQYAGKGATTPEVLLRFVEAFPENVIVCAHWGGGLPFYALMPEVAAALERVYFDSAATTFLYRPEVFAVAARLVGPERILFASDYPLLDPRRVLRQVEEAGLAPEARAALLGGNAARLLGLREALPPDAGASGS